MKSLRSTTAMVAWLTLLWGCAYFPPLPTPRGTGARAVHEIDSGAIAESSGLVRSRTHPDVFWTHNDSGDRPRLFAISPAGETLAEFHVEGASHVDWEDIAIDDAGNLWVADFGNNAGRRRDLVVYRVPEPDPAERTGVARADRRLRFRYADQTAHPQGDRHDFDAEALFWLEGALYIFTKHRSAPSTTLYLLPDTPSPEERALDPHLELDLGSDAGSVFGTITGADVTPDGRFVALLTYRGIHVFETSGRPPLPHAPVARIRLDPRRTRQVESIAWDGEALVFGNEQRRLFRIPDPLDPELDRYPSPGAPE